MHLLTRLRSIPAVVLLGLLLVGATGCDESAVATSEFFFSTPQAGQLSLVSGVEVELRVGGLVEASTLVVALDGVVIDPADLVITPQASGQFLSPGTRITTVLPNLSEGAHRLEARATMDLALGQVPASAVTTFNTVDLERPDECEILNSAHCALPFPSSAFLEQVPGQTETGLRMKFPTVTLTDVAGPPLDPAPLARLDGFAPTVQVLVHLPGVDPTLSDASRLLPEGTTPRTPPYVDLRTHDDRSLDGDSPTILMDAVTGERILHWVEVDQTPRALADPSRQVLFLRSGQALEAGRRYIVAFRNMVDSAGEPISPEATFATLRDGRPSTIVALEARRPAMEDVFDKLEANGVPRHRLQLAFDFHTRSQTQLQERMLFMRGDALAWLAALPANDVSGFANVQVQDLGDCSSPGQEIWRQVSGTFDGPYYMDNDIDVFTQVSMLNVDANDMPVRNGTHPFNWDVSVPCSVFRGEEVGHPLLLGHGFLGDGAGMVDAFTAGGFFGGNAPVAYMAGATDWRGLALGFTGPDALNILFNVIGTPESGNQFNTFEALPHRLKQGMVNTLVLSRMMKSGFFNRLPELQRTPGDPATGVFTPAAEMFYFGVSLGGIYGTMYAALNADTIRHNVDVPAMNFSILQQRSTQFPVFLDLLSAVGLTDPLELALIIGIQHELWVSADPAGYVRNITGTVDARLPGSGSEPKQMLVTVAFLDKQVSNQATNIYARSMGLPNLEGSIQAGMPGLPDVNADAGSANPGLPSAMHIYAAGYFDIFDPLYQPPMPPLANIIPSSKCDPHGTARLSIPASIEQLQTFLQPDGLIYNFCDGICDAQTANEQPSSPCDPLN